MWLLRHFSLLAGLAWAVIGPFPSSASDARSPDERPTQIVAGQQALAVIPALTEFKTSHPRPLLLSSLGDLLPAISGKLCWQRFGDQFLDGTLSPWQTLQAQRVLWQI